MATIRQFEDIEAWQCARILTREIHEFTRERRFAQDFALRDQVRRAAISVMSNIAEGFERGGSKEFAQFLSVAKASAAELESQLYIAFDQRYISGSELESFLVRSGRMKRLIGSFMSYLRRTTVRGAKFHSQPAPGSNPKPETRNPKLSSR